MRALFDSLPDDHILAKTREANPRLFDALRAGVESGMSDAEMIAFAYANGDTLFQMTLMQRSIDALRVDKALRMFDAQTPL